MAASMNHPVYTALIKKADGTKYTVTGIIQDLVTSHAKDDLAEKATLSLVNIKVGSTYLHNLIAMNDQLYVYANTGSGAKEVFRGIVWEENFVRKSDTNEIKLICYTKAIYLHKSKDNLFYKKGKKTKDIITALGKKWGITISYKYKSITHGKLVYHSQSIADIIIDILNKVKKSTNVDYAIRMEQNTLIIDSVGSNSPVYEIREKNNAINTNYRQTMEGMITKVQIVKAETVKKKSGDSETGKYLTVTSVSKNTSQYGTLQDIVVKEKDEKLADAKKEAEEILKEHATPTKEIEQTAVDNPWVKKGHKVYIASGNLNNYYIVQGIEHDALAHTMYLEVKKA